MYVVGTHKDLVDKEKIDIFDSNLQELLQSTVFYWLNIGMKETYPLKVASATM